MELVTRRGEPAGGRALGVTHEAANRYAALGQGGGQAATDEPGRAGDEDSRHPAQPYRHAREPVEDNAWYKLAVIASCHGEEPLVPTYIMLTTLTPEGVQTIKNNPGRIQEVNREVEQLGASVKAQWATLGQFDFVNVIEAPDEKTIARVSLELGSRGTGRYETLSAIPIDDFIGSI
jgi:uncharacterized protein with GYD domain